MTSLEQGDHHDKGKIRVDLIDAEFVEGMGAVLAFGAEKYDDNNWKKGIEVSRILGSLERHLLAFKRGEDFDYESQLCHLYHAGVNCMMAAWTVKYRKDLDNRVKLPQAIQDAPQKSLADDPAPPVGDE